MVNVHLQHVICISGLAGGSLCFFVFVVVVVVVFFKVEIGSRIPVHFLGQNQSLVDWRALWATMKKYNIGRTDFSRDSLDELKSERERERERKKKTKQNVV